MYFYWKISYFGNFLYTAPGQPGGQDFIRGPGPPGSTLATALASGHASGKTCPPTEAGKILRGHVPPPPRTAYVLPAAARAARHLAVLAGHEIAHADVVVFAERVEDDSARWHVDAHRERLGREQ